MPLCNYMFHMSINRISSYVCGVYIGLNGYMNIFQIIDVVLFGSMGK